MPWGVAAAAVGAVGSIAGSALSSGKGSGGSSDSSSGPWGPEVPYLTSGLQDAQTNYQAQQAQGPYGGQFYAPNNGTQQGAISQAAGWATGGQGSTLPGMTAGTSGTLQGAANPYVNNANNMATNGAGANPYASILNGYANGSTPGVSMNPALSGALGNAAIGGANALGQFSNGQAQVMNESLQDPTQGLINSATSYMNSAPTQQAVNSTNSMIDQTLNEQTVPQLNRTAAMGGSLNSSRAGMAESMANEGAALAKGNADSSILNNAFNTGLSTAATERNAGLTTGMYAANSGLVDNANIASGLLNTQIGAGEFNTNTSLNAANSGMNYNLGNANIQLGANGQLGNAAGLGINGATAAGNQASGNFALGAAAGGLQQTGDQSVDNNAYAQWQMQNQYNQGILQQYMGIVGNPYGSTSNSSSSVPPNYLGSALGGGLAGAGLYNQYGSNLFNGGNANSQAYAAATSPQNVSGAMGPAFGNGQAVGPGGGFYSY